MANFAVVSSGLAGFEHVVYSSVGHSTGDSFLNQLPHRLRRLFNKKKLTQLFGCAAAADSAASSKCAAGPGRSGKRSLR